MNKNIIALAVTAFAFSALVSSCSDSDWSNEEGYGKISLVPTLKAAATDNNTADVPEAESLMVWISNSRGLIRRYNSFSEIPASVSLRAGHYVAEGWAGDSVPASFTSRYFKGISEFDVTVGGKTNVNLNCRIANALVSVEYSSDAEEVIADYSLTVANRGGSVEFAGRDTRCAYFMMGKKETVLTYTLSGTKVTGEAFSQTGEITNVKPATEYKLTVTPGQIESSAEGAAFFNVAVDTSTIDEETEIVITLSPEIVGKDFKLENGVSGDPGAFSDVIVEAYAGAEIKSVKIGCLALEQILGAETVELFADPETAASLKEKGVDFTYTYYPETDMSTLSLTFGAAFLNALPGGEYPIAITVTDGNEKSSQAILNVIVAGGADMPVLPTAIDGTADVWATHATLRGTVINPASDFGFRYRKAGTSEWISVPATTSGSEFSTEISGLIPGTEYEYVATAGDYVGTVLRSFTTELALTIPNGDFETWNTTGKTYLLAESESTRFWDTGNHGSSTLNKNITNPESTIKHGGQYSAKLSSQFVGVMGIGKFAAGNAFVGQYLGTDGTDGIIGMGRPFASRPSALKGYVRYEPAAVTYSSVSELPKGEMDKGVVYVALIADEGLETYNGSSWPFVIKTKTSDQRLFDRTDPRVIAFGEMLLTETTEGSGLVEFTLPLEYYRTDTKAAYLMIVCSASYYGDYFTGGPSTMYIDDFTFEY